MVGDFHIRLNGVRWNRFKVAFINAARMTDTRGWYASPPTVNFLSLPSLRFSCEGTLISTLTSVLQPSCSKDLESDVRLASFLSMFLIAVSALNPERSLSLKSSARRTSLTSLVVSAPDFSPFPVNCHAISLHINIFAHGQGGGLGRMSEPSAGLPSLVDLQSSQAEMLCSGSYEGRCQYSRAIPNLLKLVRNESKTCKITRGKKEVEGGSGSTGWGGSGG